MKRAHLLAYLDADTVEDIRRVLNDARAGLEKMGFKVNGGWSETRHGYEDVRQEHERKVKVKIG